MPFFKNFTVGSFPSTGLLIPNGALRHDVVNLIADAIIATSGGYVKEVTNADPTPAAIRVYASAGITPGGDSPQSTNNFIHRTLRLGNDPLPPIIRIAPSSAGIWISILHTAEQSAQDNNSPLWQTLSINSSYAGTGTWQAKTGAQVNQTNRSIIPIAKLPTTGVVGSSAGAWVANRVYICGGDDWLYVTVHRESDGENAGDFYVAQMPLPADGHYADYGRFLGYRPSSATSDGLPWIIAEQGVFYTPRSSPAFTASVTPVSQVIGTLPNLPIPPAPGAPTPNGRFVLVRPYFSIQQGNESRFIGRVPGMWIGPLLPAIPKYGTLTLGGRQLICLCRAGAIWFFEIA